ncbi:glycosyltransferase family 1 protein [Arthrobacter sp. H5]|uniref:glycosyltransferase family 1 protein n=1 Tax=Arthrobacter sp. H5 TaxID=1267973 RepID=UPI0012DEE2E9|nr:glycosyltransferase family 1 protein [Arthrobacter sp. H5]
MNESPEISRRPRILVLSFSTIIRDPRVLRQIQLFKESADVVSCGYGVAPEGVVKHIEIPEAHKSWRRSYKHVALLLALRAHHRLYFGSERVRFVRDHVPEQSVDIVIANDALGVPLALALQPRLGVHADLHEYAPRQGEDNRRWKLLIGPLMDWACRQHVTKADSVSTVAKGIAEEYSSVYGIPEPTVVPNAAVYDRRFAPTPVESPLRLIHTGAAGRGRKIEVMIDAVAQANSLKAGTATLDVVLVPGEQRYIDELAVQAAVVPDGAVRMVPPVSFDQIVPMLHGYDIGIFLCPPSTFNLRHALPNKLFEFVQARLAVLIGPSPEMELVVRRHNLGWVAEDFDAASTARLLVGLTSEEVVAMKRASHDAAEELGAERVSEPWTDAVQNLLRTSR